METIANRDGITETGNIVRGGGINVSGGTSPIVPHSNGFFIINETDDTVSLDVKFWSDPVGSDYQRRKFPPIPTIMPYLIKEIKQNTGITYGIYWGA
jgi:hypothetical protein